ncbi:hypothetical protein [Castellaniella sp.]|uniref:hypothetical protein n=1 Tax=Castellaniella sp. TaxID=1955812 RepID=UPI0035676B08
MPLPGFGLHITRINVAADDEPGFNEWFDKEHLPERVRIDGFVSGRRYRALEGTDRYLAICTTRAVNVFTGPAYHQAISHPTERTQHYLTRFQTGSRAIATVVQSHGQGHGAFLAFITVAPGNDGTKADDDPLQARVQALLARAVTQNDIIAAHWVRCHPELSKSFVDDDAAGPMNGWYALIEGTNAAAVHAQAQQFIDALRSPAGRMDHIGDTDYMNDAGRHTVTLAGLYGLTLGLEKNEL